jgi:sterol desaturase/sphingolipid hydroxylase (fatty acid hydroxylase superfamily)
MDATTAFRFHFGEYILSGALSALQLLIVGPQIELLLAYELVVTFVVPLHHSNWDWGKRWEPLLSRFIVTPGIHAVHHSNTARDTDSNYSTIFSVWDKLFGTSRPARASST